MNLNTFFIKNRLQIGKLNLSSKDSGNQKRKALHRYDKVVNKAPIFGKATHATL